MHLRRLGQLVTRLFAKEVTAVKSSSSDSPVQSRSLVKTLCLVPTTAFLQVLVALVNNRCECALWQRSSFSHSRSVSLPRQHFLSWSDGLPRSVASRRTDVRGVHRCDSSWRTHLRRASTCRLATAKTDVACGCSGSEVNVICVGFSAGATAPRLAAFASARNCWMTVQPATTSRLTQSILVQISEALVSARSLG